VAIYHLSVKPVARRSGRSAPAAAAYRIAARVVDHMRGIVHDYEQRTGVAYVEAILPADAPEWARDASALWTAAERAEKRCDARTAREVELALHADLSLAQNTQLARDFAQALTDRDGAGGHLAIHVPDRLDRALRADPAARDVPLRDLCERVRADLNIHAHLLRTTRRIGPEGLGEKTVEWDDSSGPDTVRRARGTWADMSNEAFERAGLATRIDHRSYHDQGRLELPTIHLGPKATVLERMGIPTRRGDENRATELRNAVVRDVVDLLEISERGKAVALPEAERSARALQKRVTPPEREISGELADVVRLDRKAVAFVDVGDRIVGVGVPNPAYANRIGEAVRVERDGPAWQLVFDRLERAGETLYRLAGDVQSYIAKITQPDPVVVAERDAQRIGAERLYGAFAAERERNEQLRDRERAAVAREHAKRERAIAKLAAKATTRDALHEVARASRAYGGQVRRDRAALREKLGPKLTWERFIGERASQGDDVAIATLYRLHAQDREREHARAPQRFELERDRLPVARTIDGYTFRADRDGTVAYLDPHGDVAFRDAGATIDVHDRNAARGALTIARVNARAPVGVRGDDVFRDRALKSAVELGITVRDRELLGRARELAQQLAHGLRAKSERLALD
jgi:hypothetical protein